MVHRHLLDRHQKIDCTGINKTCPKCEADYNISGGVASHKCSRFLAIMLREIVGAEAYRAALQRLSGHDKTQNTFGTLEK